MTETLTQRVLAAVFEDTAIDDELVHELALSADAHGELVRLAGVLARLPGDGARAAERRLDGLFDDVASIAASESRVPPDAAATLTASSTQPIAPPRAVPAAPPATDVRSPRPQARSRTKPRWLVAGGAMAAAAAYLALYLSPASSPSQSQSPAGAPPQLSPEPAPPAVTPPPALPPVELIIRALPANATISLDGVLFEGNPVVLTRATDKVEHRVHVAAPGYVPQDVEFLLESNVEVKVTLQSLPRPRLDRERAVQAKPPAASVKPPARPIDRNGAYDVPPRPRY